MGINKSIREGMGLFLYNIMGMGWEWEYGHGNGRIWDRKRHSRTFVIRLSKDLFILYFFGRKSPHIQNKYEHKKHLIKNSKLHSHFTNYSIIFNSIKLCGFSVTLSPLNLISARIWKFVVLFALNFSFYFLILCFLVLMYFLFLLS